METVTTAAVDGTEQTYFAFMAETATGPQVCSNPPYVTQSCSSCSVNEQKMEKYKEHNTRLVNDLSDCIEANKVLKEN